MKIRPFSLERYFAQHEFATQFLLGSSNPEPMTVGEVLALEPGASLDGLSLGYTEATGHPALRAAIASRYTTIAPDDVLVCSGAEEPIFAFMNVVLSAGDHVVVHGPAYASHFEIARAIGAEVSMWTGDEARGWALDPEELGRLIRPNTKAIVVSVPHNPTGFLFTPDAWQRVIDIAQHHGVWLFSDEVYRGLEHDPATRLPAACDRYERAVSLDGLAKSYALAGLRIGWLACRDRALLAEVVAYKDYLTICNAAPSEQLAILAVKHAETLFTRSRERLVKNLDHLATFLARHRNLFAWTRPHAGTTALVRVRGGHATAFCEGLLRRAGVMLVPSTHFGSGDEHVRFGYGRANLPEALAALEAAL